eukprot:259128-Pyramimonas_sp.AAC.1
MATQSANTTSPAASTTSSVVDDDQHGGVINYGAGVGDTVSYDDSRLIDENVSVSSNRCSNSDASGVPVGRCHRDSDIVLPTPSAHTMYSSVFLLFKQQYPALKKAGTFDYRSSINAPPAG